VKTKLVSDLSGVHGILSGLSATIILSYLLRITYGQILFVGEDEEKSVTEFVLVKHAL
jgi:hypothetical protein